MGKRTSNLCRLLVLVAAAATLLAPEAGCRKRSRADKQARARADEPVVDGRRADESAQEVDASEDQQTSVTEDGRASGRRPTDARPGRPGDDEPAVEPAGAELTPEAAKAALVELVRRNPGEFIGDPDPDRLAELPLTNLGNAQHSFGAFVIDLGNNTYSAFIGQDGPEPYLYEGRFEPGDDGQWLAAKPDLTRYHQDPEDRRSSEPKQSPENQQVPEDDQSPEDQAAPDEEVPDDTAPEEQAVEEQAPESETADETASEVREPDEQVTGEEVTQEQATEEQETGEQAPGQQDSEGQAPGEEAPGGE